MKDIEMLKSLTKEVIEKDKLDVVYDEILMPRLKRAASELKKSELEISQNCHDVQMGFKLAKIMGKNITLQTLVETQMKPYLEEKGFKVVIWSPNYSVDIRW